MNDSLQDFFRHNAWANRMVLEYCRSLTAEQLVRTEPAVFGNVLSTMQHLLGAEWFYSGLLLGHAPTWDYDDARTPSIDEMLVWNSDMEAAWNELCSRPFDANAVVVQRRDGRPDTERRCGLLVTQAIHHGNVHREQMCHILTSLGLEPLDVSAWRWERETS
jgi:uncharacterized damage-inducible protein DinB